MFRPRLVAVAVLAGLVGTTLPARAESLTRALQLPPFRAVEAQGNFRVDVTANRPQLVTLAGDRSIIDRVKASVTGGVLLLSLRPDTHPHFFGDSRQPRCAIS
ncbi:MAG: hypothetical protein KGR26_13670, partial [Cyanobacteria bacterium REEB65]|nr:hypothetical protein [Cyanobacteria bacterium REEB65]